MVGGDFGFYSELLLLKLQLRAHILIHPSSEKYNLDYFQYPPRKFLVNHFFWLHYNDHYLKQVSLSVFALEF